MQKKEQVRKNIRTCSLARCKGEALKSNFRPEMYESERNGCHQRDALKTVPRTVFLTGFRIPCSKNAKKRTSPEEYPNLFFGALQGIRTPDLLVRSQTLSPAELAAHMRVKALASHRRNIVPLNEIFVKQKFNFLFLNKSLLSTCKKREKDNKIRSYFRKF